MTDLPPGMASAAGAPGRRSPLEEPEAALEVAARAARRAGRIQVERYERFEWVEHKSARDVVTEVDHLCERAIIDTIRAAFPDDALLAEESGAHAGARARGAREHLGGAGAVAEGEGGPALSSARVWLVDPLDGTVNYANGLPFFCASVALVEGGAVVVGAVFDPLHDELFTAMRGQGARLNGREIRNPDKEHLIDYVISLGLKTRDVTEREPLIRRSTRGSRHLGSSALSLSYVACGRFDAFTQVGGLANWDIAAAGLVAEEAGVLVTTLAGEPWFDLARPPGSIGILAAPARHHAELLALLR
jgi:myo-inositol-1(or 4)-monophosphatase